MAIGWAGLALIPPLIVLLARNVEVADRLLALWTRRPW
jgi:hypothetical protein